MTKLGLIDNWRKAWKLASIQWSVIGIALTWLVDFLNSIWYSLPPQIVQKIPHSSHISIAIFVCVIIGRLLKKKEKPDGDQQ